MLRQCLPPTTCHVSCVKCHVSRVKCHILRKRWSQSVEGLLSTRPTPFSFVMDFNLPNTLQRHLKLIFKSFHCYLIYANQVLISRIYALYISYLGSIRNLKFNISALLVPISCTCCKRDFAKNMPCQVQCQLRKFSFNYFQDQYVKVYSYTNILLTENCWKTEKYIYIYRYIYIYFG